MKKPDTFWLALLSGLGAIASVSRSPNFQHRPTGSDLQRMRQDVQRIGDSMYHIIQREHAQQSSSQASA